MNPNRIFVFGSNLAGRHGAGAALFAKRHFGAVYGKGEGLQGASYAIPTKGWMIETLPLEAIEKHVERFKAFARARPDLSFQITAVGCGLAGYTPEQIAPLFIDAPRNCCLPPEFARALRHSRATAGDSDEFIRRTRP